LSQFVSTTAAGKELDDKAIKAEKFLRNSRLDDFDDIINQL